METVVKHEGIELDLRMNQEVVKLKDDLWSHPATILSTVGIADLPTLNSLTLWG